MRGWLARLGGLIGMGCAALLLCAPGAARAQGVPGRPVSTCIAPARAGDTPAAMLASPSRFTCGLRQTAFGAGSFWVRSGPLPPRVGVDGPIEVRLASLWQDRLTMWAVYADGRATRMALDGRGVTRRLRLGAIVALPLAPRGVAITRLLWRIDGSANLRGVVLGAVLASPADAERSDLRMCALYAGFAGLCLALLIYNLSLWAAMRHRFQLIYCLMVAALLAYAASSSGALAWVFPDLANNDRLRINYAALALAASAALLFARSFFERHIFAGWLGRVALVIAAAQIGSALLFVTLAPLAIGWLDRLYAASFVPLLGIVAPMLWRASRLRSRYLPMFIVAWGLPVAMGGLRVAAGLNLLGYHLWLDNSTILSMSVEALLSSIAIAYRIRLLGRERDAALESEEEARALADTDPLTGLLNRRAFLRDAIGRPGEQVLMLADIDHFKRVNDTLGHDGGDEVLRLVARALRAIAPPGALVARMGGEEFAMLTATRASLPAQRIVEQVRATRMPSGLAVTVSVGSCAGPLLAEADWKALYRLADTALYDAKAAGRDRVRDAPAIAWAA